MANENKSTEGNKDKGFGWPHIIGGAVIVLVVTLLYGALVSCVFFEGFNAQASQFGESFGALNAFVSALATFGVIAALIMQQRQLRTQQDEIRESTKAQAEQIAVMKESALAARAQVAAFGAEGVERFLVQSRALLHDMNAVTRDLLSTSSQDFRDSVPSAARLPATPLFCSSPSIVQQAERIQAEFVGAIANLTSSASQRYELYRKRFESSPRSREGSLPPAEQIASKCADETLPLIQDLLGELQSTAAEWFLRMQDPESIGSGERPATAPEKETA